MPKGIYERTKEETKEELVSAPTLLSKRGACLNCAHEKKDHYGSLHNQCNVRECECDFYKKV